jgi:CRISPR-associated protein Csx1
MHSIFKFLEMNCILQVLGKFNYEEVSYDIENKEYKCKLASEALQAHFKEYKVILLAPESLVALLAEDVNEAIELLKKPNELKERIKNEVLKNNLLKSEFKIILMQSIGSYSLKANNNFTINFKNDVNNVVIYLLLNFLEELKDVEKIIADTSSGHNIYVSSLIEALRLLLAYCKLKSYLQQPRINIKLAFSPPIGQSKENLYPINLYDYNVKAFFDFPVKEKVELLSKNALTEIKKLEKKYLKPLNAIISSGRIMFNAIKYNVPLAIFYKEIIELEKSVEEGEEMLKEILYRIEEEKSIESDGKISRITLNRTAIVNMLLSLALTSSIKEFLSGISQATIKNIEDSFSRLYEKVGLGLNKRFLKRDLSKIKIEEDWKKIKSSSNDPRDFFAHSGLLKSFIDREKIDDEEILLRYKPKKVNLIKKWLKNPENY